MDIGSIGSVSSASSQAQTGDAIAITVLKKANDIQAQNALQLIQALPQPVANSTSGRSGGIDTFA